MSMSGGMDNIASALRGLLATQGVVGDSGTYYHRNDSGYSFYFAWAASAIDADTSFGATNDFEESQITMPKQSGSSGLEPSPGDLIAVDSIYWSVLSVKKLGLPSNPCAWTLRIRREPEANSVP